MCHAVNKEDIAAIMVYHNGGSMGILLVWITFALLMTNNILSLTSVNMISPLEYSIIQDWVYHHSPKERVNRSGSSHHGRSCWSFQGWVKCHFEENKYSNRRRNVHAQINLSVLACTKLDAIRYEVELRAMCSSPMPLEKIQSLENTEARRLFARGNSVRKSWRELRTSQTPKFQFGSRYIYSFLRLNIKYVDCYCP